MSNEEIVGLIKEEIAASLNQHPDSIDENARILKIGVSSVQALKIINHIRKKLKVDINPVALFEYKTIATFAGYLGECLKENECFQEKIG